MNNTLGLFWNTTKCCCQEATVLIYIHTVPKELISPREKQVVKLAHLHSGTLQTLSSEHQWCLFSEIRIKCVPQTSLRGCSPFAYLCR